MGKYNSNKFEYNFRIEGDYYNNLYVEGGLLMMKDH